MTAIVPSGGDDTAALQRALHSGGDIQLAAGSFTADGLVIGSGTRLQGAGCGITVIRPLSAVAAVLTASPEAGAITVANLALEGFGYGTAAPNGVGINFSGTAAATPIQQVRVVDVIFMGFALAASHRLNASLWIERCVAFGCEAGFLIDICDDTTLAKCKAQHFPPTAPANIGYGFTIRDDEQHGTAGEGVWLDTCTTDGQYGGLLVETQNWGGASQCSFTSCSGHALAILGANTWQIIGGQFSSNIATPRQAGIYISRGAQNVSITGATCVGNQWGAVVDGASIALSGCTLNNNEFDVVLGGAAKGCAISGNICRSAINGSVSEQPGADFNVIVGNVLARGVGLRGVHSVQTGNVEAS